MGKKIKWGRTYERKGRVKEKGKGRVKGKREKEKSLLLQLFFSSSYPSLSLFSNSSLAKSPERGHAESFVCVPHFDGGVRAGRDNVFAATAQLDVVYPISVVLHALEIGRYLHDMSHAS